MRSSLKQRWAAALRSGDYKQGTGKLCKVEQQGDYTEVFINNQEWVGGYTEEPTLAYCCLGVLAEICGFSYDREIAGVLDSDQLCKVGMTEAEQKMFVNLNDELHQDFDQISDVVLALMSTDEPWELS